MGGSCLRELTAQPHTLAFPCAPLKKRKCWRSVREAGANLLRSPAADEDKDHGLQPSPKRFSQLLPFPVVLSGTLAGFNRMPAHSPEAHMHLAASFRSPHG